MSKTESPSVLASYLPIGIYLGLLVAVAAFIIILSHLLDPRKCPTSPEWSEAFECGLKSKGLAQDRYPVKYYLVAMLFVVFDIETVFLFPWAVTLDAFKQSDLGGFWFVEMLVFIVILLVGYVYIVKKGVLEWSSE